MIRKVTEQELDDKLKIALQRATNLDETLQIFYESIMQEISRVMRLGDNSRKNSDPLGAYPDGITIMRINLPGSGFPHDFGAVVTFKSGVYGFQFFSNNLERDETIPVMFQRSWMPAVSKWNEWDQPETARGAQNKVDSHSNRTDNPHKVTKSQVGLGNVDNVKQATKTEFDAHVNNKNNPHNVTKSQLGLGNVDNVKQATKTEFDNHVKNFNDHVDDFESHINNKSNPHNVTKSQVGLGNVDNVKQATKAEFDSHVSNFNDHVNNKNNPHGVTKAQVGLGNVDNVKQATKTEFDNHVNNKNNPHGVTKAQVGLGNVDNVQQASKAEFNNHNSDNTRHITSAERTSWNNKVNRSGDTMTGALTLHGDPTNNLHAATKRYVDNIKTNLENKNNQQDSRLDRIEIDRPEVPFGMKGQVPFITTNNSNTIEVDHVVKEVMVVDNDADLAAAKEIFTSNREIFDQWGRFSHDTTSNQPANSSELNSWTYDSENDQIICTVNSTTHIGFYSDKKYDNYVHQATVYAIDSDDDDIGLLIAFAVDSNGREHTLTAIRCANLNQGHTRVAGENYNWAIIYNHKRSDAKMIANGTDLLTNKTESTRWDSIPNGAVIRIHRMGDIIEAYTSELNSTTINQNTKLRIDLRDDPVLAVFRGPQSYGYTSHSQNRSSYKDIYFSDAANVIYDIRDGKVWVADSNGNYKVDSSKKLSELGVGRILHNESTGKLFFVQDNNKIIPIGRRTYRTTRNISAGEKYTIDVHSIFTPNTNARDLIIQASVRDTDSSSPTRGMFINSEAVATVGRDDRYITIVNEHTLTLEFNIVVMR